MTNKTLALGAVVALCMAGGQANAVQLCPTAPTVIGTLITSTSGSHFSCTLGDLDFSEFNFLKEDPTILMQSVFFSESGQVVGSPGPVTTITFEKGPGFANYGTSINFAVDEEDSATKRIDSYTLDVSGGKLTDGMIYGDNSGPNPIGGQGSFTNTLTNLYDTRDHLNILTIQEPDGSPINSITSVFTQVDAVSSAVPEPMSLSLFAIGLAGVGFARRRRS